MNTKHLGSGLVRMLPVESIGRRQIYACQIKRDVTLELYCTMPDTSTYDIIGFDGGNRWKGHTNE